MTKVKSGTVNEYQKQRRDQAKLKALDYLGGQCMYCKTEDSEALRFVHRASDEKAFGISTGLTKAWETLRPELDKCALICKDCAGRGADPDTTPTATLAELQEASLDRYTKAGEEEHAVLWRDYHNARADLGKPTASCDCDYCEDGYGDLNPLPEAYVRLLPSLRFAESEKPTVLRKN